MALFIGKAVRYAAASPPEAALCWASAPTERLETDWHVGCWVINKDTQGHFCKGAMRVGRMEGLGGGVSGLNVEAQPTGVSWSKAGMLVRC